jgi:putative peptide zinc metalloprotease protein
MTATADETLVLHPGGDAPARAEGIELLGPVHGSGYKDGAALVRRADGQVVQLGPLMYALLEEIDGRRGDAELAAALCEKLGRGCSEEHVAALAQKLEAQGLLAGTEHNAPPRRNPLLALRWKVLVTDPKWTSRLTAPFTWLFSPFVVWPVVAAFAAVAVYVLFFKGVAGATSQAFDKPGLLLLIFALTIASAGFHELGHAAATRYGGATPGGMGMGIYLVWPAFYTDVTDAYRLPRRDRLRVDLGGIYFNAVVAVATFAAWLALHVDALVLLIALQLLMMAKNLSPVIRSDGYHILSDATGVPDLYAHIRPTLGRLLPWRRREPSALSGRARWLVTIWVLIVVPVLLALMLGAVLLLPRLAATAWDSGRTIGSALPHRSATGVLSSLLQLLALALPVLGSVLVAFSLARLYVRRARAWSRGRPLRGLAAVALAGLIACGAAYAWWPAGQYQAVQPYEHGTLTSLGHVIASPRSIAAPAFRVQPGTHLALAMVPVGGATKTHPALLVIPGTDGRPATAIIATGSRAGTAFPFTLPAPPKPGDSQALAVNTTDGGVVYKVAYSLVTISDGSDVTNANTAFAFANCKACTTVAVSFQIVLVVGQSKTIAPLNAAGAENGDCPACMTTAIADQIVVTLSKQPTQDLIDRLQAALQQLNALPALGAGGTPAAIAAQVAAVQQQVDQVLKDSGLQTTTETTQQSTTQQTTTPQATTTAPTATTHATTTQPSTTQPETTSPATTTGPTTTTTGSTTTTTPSTTDTTTTTTTSSG